MGLAQHLLNALFDCSCLEVLTRARLLGEIDMSVELIATKSSDSVLLESLPAVIGQGGGSAHVEDSIPGSFHCLVSLVDSQLVVWDLGTAGGTFVNGSRVTRAAIRPGDTLKLGGMDVEVKYRPHARHYLLGVRS